MIERFIVGGWRVPTIALLAFLVVPRPLASQTPAPEATSREQPSKEMLTGIGKNAVRAPFKKFLLMRQDRRGVALRIIEHPAPVPYRARYEWYAQDDGSMDFKKPNVRHGTGEVYEKTALPDGSEDLQIEAGSWRLTWSASDWIYFPDWQFDSRLSMARTQWERLSDVNAHSKALKWTTAGNLVAWGPAKAGLQLGVVEEFLADSFMGSNVSWLLIVRNVSRKPINLGYYQPSYLFARPSITNAQGKPIQVPEPFLNFPVAPATKLLQPGEAFKISAYALQLGPRPGDFQTADPFLDVSPGKYAVTFTYDFRASQKPAWQGTLQSGTLTLNIQPRQTSSRAANRHLALRPAPP